MFKLHFSIGTVLTLAATGSEANPGSVITNWETKEKYGWGSPLVYPQFSILDPVNTFSVPKNQTVYGMVDMMSHVFESYFHPVLICSPNNPTVTQLEQAELVMLADIVKKHDLLVISDEIYAELAYDEVFTSFAAIDGMMERTIVINGFSKGFAMTGWRTIDHFTVIIFDHIKKWCIDG